MRKKPVYRQHEKMGGGDPLKMAGLKDARKKYLKKHGVDIDKLYEETQKLIKAHERKLLREAKPKYKH